MFTKIHYSFPGIQPKDDILSLLKLMSSKNPSNDIATQILLHRGYDPCLKFTDNEKFWSSYKPCEPGFIPDFKNGYCYYLLPIKKNLQDGDDFCRNNYDGELLLFDKNSEVEELITLINTSLYKLNDL